MSTTKKENFEERKTTVITADNSREFSLQIIFKEGNNNKTIIQELLEIAVKHNVRSYHDNLFTHYSKETLQNFQKEVMSKNYKCNFIFRSPKPLI